MSSASVRVGQEVTLGGYPDDWLRVERADGDRLRVCHTFGSTLQHSAGFWIDVGAVRNIRSATRLPPP